MEVLFITHKFPPATGGMEKFSYELYKGMQSLTKVHILAYEGEGSRVLWFIQLRNKIKEMLRQHPSIQIIHLNDGLMVSFGWWIKKVSGRKVVATLHGLDVVFPLPYFQSKILPRFNHLDGLACVSNATRMAAISRGINPEKIIVINNGVDHELLKSEPDFDKIKTIRNRLHIPDSKIIITAMGRAVKRKGFSWFVDKVLPSLQDNVVFVLMGPQVKTSTGFWQRLLPAQWRNRWSLMMGLATDEEALQRLHEEYKDRFVRTGYLHFDEIVQLIQGSAAFVMPNIEVEGDMEGFGLVALEAVLCGTTVFAADLEGIQDAIQDDKNGYILPAGNAEAWISRLTQFVTSGHTKENAEKFQVYTTDKFSWEKMSKQYLDWFRLVTG